MASHFERARGSVSPLAHEKMKWGATVNEASPFERCPLENACSDEEPPANNPARAHHHRGEKCRAMKAPLRERGDGAEGSPNDEIAEHECRGRRERALAIPVISFDFGEDQYHRSGRWHHHCHHHHRPHDEHEDEVDDAPGLHLGHGHFAHL